MTDVLAVPYEIRMSMQSLFHFANTRRVERWHKVAKKSGLFRDPRCMLFLRLKLEARKRGY